MVALLVSLYHMLVTVCHRLRTDLIVSRQDLPGGVVYVVKDPSVGRFVRLKEVEEEFREVATPYQMMCLRSGLSHAESQVGFLRGIEEEIRELAREEGGTQTDMGA